MTLGLARASQGQETEPTPGGEKNQAKGPGDRPSSPSHPSVQGRRGGLSHPLPPPPRRSRLKPQSQPGSGGLPAVLGPGAGICPHRPYRHPPGGSFPLRLNIRALQRPLRGGTSSGTVVTLRRQGGITQPELAGPSPCRLLTAHRTENPQ